MAAARNHRAQPSEGACVSYLLGVPVGDGADDVVVFEVDRGEIPGDLVLASAEPGKVAARARASLEDALEGVKPSLLKIVEMLREITPEQTTVEFGLKLGGETGMIIAKGTAEVNFKVTMSWGAGKPAQPEKSE
ncbi:MAG: CU044_2847 family protein [Pseudonocardiaceae bacterium]